MKEPSRARIPVRFDAIVGGKVVGFAEDRRPRSRKRPLRKGDRVTTHDGDHECDGVVTMAERGFVHVRLDINTWRTL